MSEKALKAVKQWHGQSQCQLVGQSSLKIKSKHKKQQTFKEGDILRSTKSSKKWANQK